ncbi:unnamed protein product, partial [Brachionus calyciflorus]
MKETIKSSLSDKHVWMCTKCGEFRSIRYNSFFSQFDIRLDKILKIIFHWCLQMNHKDVKELVGVSEPTINKIFQKLRLLCLNNLKRESFILGGEGEVVEIDESLFVRVKHNVGKDLSRKQIWVFGMYQRSNKKCLFYVVPKRDAVNLLNLIYKHIAPNSVIYSDCWKSYNRIKKLNKNYMHLTVNHDLHFVDPKTGVHTNGIESIWCAAKAYFKKMRGTNRLYLQSYLDEFYWRHNHNLSRTGAI